jgi:hypothetical protein
VGVGVKVKGSETALWIIKVANKNKWKNAKEND